MSVLFNDSFFLQFLIIYTLYNVYNSVSLYYTVFYFTVLTVFLGLFLALYQLDLFTAFLWLAEFVIIFISMLFTFFLNVYSNVQKNNKFFYNLKFFGFFFFVFFFLSYYSIVSDNNQTSFNFLNSYLYDNFYENLNIQILNDFYSFFKSYYFYNSVEFLSVGYLLLLGSLICVNLNFFSKNNKILNYYDFFLVFDFFKDFSKFIFMRKQNLVDQLNTPVGTRIFKKKSI